MRQCVLSVLERKTRFENDFVTEPYEAGWASEAIFFIQIESIKGKLDKLDVFTQISPDGIRWVDEKTSLGGMTEEELYFLRVRHFGGWLRLVGKIQGEDACLELTIRLVLKE